MTKHIIIYHDHCNDGFGAAFIAHQHLTALGTEVELLPANYNGILDLETVRDKHVHILDFSFSVKGLLEICEAAEEVTWLDHHKTAIDAFAAEGYMSGQKAAPENLRYHLTDKHSGAMLAYMHYTGKVGENLIPYWVSLVDDRDRWVWRFGEDAKAFHAGSSLYERTVEDWKYITENVNAVIVEGAAVLKYQQNLYKQLLETAHEITIDGQKGLAANVPGQFASDLGHLLCKQSGTFGATYHSDGKGYKFSLRSEGDYDVSKIAKSFNGGGHKNAAGFIIEHPLDVAASGLTLWSTTDELTQYAADAGSV